MRILLLLPAAEHLRVTSRGQRVPRRKMLRFSLLPLTTVAALTPPGHEVLLCDENVQPVDLELEVDLVGISFMTALAPRAYELARAFRSRGCAVVAGGYHPTLCPEETLRHFDAVVQGDAEELWPRLVKDLAAGRLQRLYRHDHPVPLAASPIPRRDLLAATARHYATINAVQAGRGCRHGCRYCSVTAFHRRSYRHRPLESVLAEIAAIDGDFLFVDDNLIADRRFARELLRAMAPLRKRWVSQCSLEIARDPELLDLAARAGCRGLFIGIETLSERNLRGIDKGFQKVREYRADIAAIHRHGIGVIAGVIVGMDHDGRGVFRRTLRFLQRARVDALQLNIFTPLPGTPLFASCAAQGRILSRDWSRYDFRHVVIRPRTMSAAELQAGADWLYRAFYRLDRVLLRGLRALLRPGLIPALLGLRLALTYRYDNRREGIRGGDPGRVRFRPGASGPLRERRGVRPTTRRTA